MKLSKIMSLVHSPLSNSAPCVPSILSVAANSSSDEESPASNTTHSRGNSYGSDQIILPRLRLPSPADSTQSHASYREDELEGEIKRLKKEVETKFKENTKLISDRKDMDNELNELTESLFTEANNMVNEAKRKQRNADKRLEEALLKIEYFKDESKSLKKRILALEKANTQMENQIQAAIAKHSSLKGKKKSNWLSKSSLLSKEEMSIDSQNSLPLEDSNITVFTTQHDTMIKGSVYKQVEEWMLSPTLATSSPLMFESINQDIRPCLTFPNEELSGEIQEAIQLNTFMMESVLPKCATKAPENNQCDLTYEADQPCQYKIKIAENSDWYYVNNRARQRIAIVCEFFQYLRYMKDGLIKPDVKTALLSIQKLRANMALTRLSLTELVTIPNKPEACLQSLQ